MNTDSIEMVIALFVPLIVAALKKTGSSQIENAVIALVIYVVAGVAAVVVSGPIDVNNLIPTITIFVTVGTVAYQLFWKNWGDPQVTAKLRG